MFRSKNLNICLVKRNVTNKSSLTSKPAKKDTKKYTATINLPKTKFQVWIQPQRRCELDVHIQKVTVTLFLLEYVTAAFRVVYPEAPTGPAVQWVPLVANTVTYRSVDPTNLDNLQIAQFHSQDAAGRYVFGFNTPDQSRIEARSDDGKVRGSYSFLDPFGRMVKAEYWDNGQGFHLAQPANMHVYTPEVQAARDLHFHLYNRALQAALAVNPVGPGQFLGTVQVEHHGFGDNGGISYDQHHKLPTNRDEPSKDSSSSLVGGNKKPSSSISSITSSSSSSASSSTNFDGQSAFGSKPAFGQTDFSKPSYEQPSTDFGSSDFGAASGSSGSDFGSSTSFSSKPEYGQPNYGQNDFNKQPDYGQEDYNSKPDYPYEPSQDFYSKVEQQYDFVDAPNNKEIFDADKEAIIVDSSETLDGELKQRSRKSVGEIFRLDRNIKNINVDIIPVQLTRVGVDGFINQFETASQMEEQLQDHTHKVAIPESLYASLHGAIPVDAVHDSQASPKQQTILPNHQISPVFLNFHKQ